MFASELNRLITSDNLLKNVFAGFNSKDYLPKIKISTKQPRAFIINTYYSDSIGEHWILTYFTKKTKYVLDPLAMPIEHYGREFEQWLPTQANVIKLKKPVQADRSILCGLFVLYFMYHLSRGKRLSTILRSFSPAIHCNDKIVLSFARQKLGYRGRIRYLHCRRNMSIYKSRLSNDFKKTKQHGRKNCRI